MKKKLWILQLPIIAAATYGFLIVHWGSQGLLESPFSRNWLFPKLRSLQGKVTDLKFNVRGPETPKNRVVIVEIDSPSLEAFGRWPWHRDKTAYLIDRIHQAGAKVIGLDMVFSEPDKRVSEELRGILQEHKLDQFIPDLETDNQLATVIKSTKNNVVLGWTSENSCIPALDNGDECPISDKTRVSELPEELDRFSYEQFVGPTIFDQTKAHLITNLNFIANIPLFSKEALHAGYFNTWQDNDGITRRTNLVTTAQNQAFPSLALAMAKVGLNEKLELERTAENKVAKIRFTGSGKIIETTELGAMEINFRGPGYTFQYVSALDVMEDSKEYTVSKGRALASVPRLEGLTILKDAYVLVGLSALGAFDMRAFPFDSNVPGVEGHANILDNLLAGDWLLGESKSAPEWILLILMTIGAIFFALAISRLESVPALLVFVFVMSGFTFGDFYVLFSKFKINWNTSLLYMELTSMFVFTLAMNYVLEERNKKYKFKQLRRR